MRALAVILLMAVLAGCSYGVAEYSVRPYLDGQGRERCCEITIRNGKEFVSLEASFSRADNGTCAVTLREQGVKAFEGQQAAAEALRQTIGETVNAAVKAALAGGL